MHLRLQIYLPLIWVFSSLLVNAETNSIPTFTLPPSGSDGSDIGFFDMEAFVVYGGAIEVIDGMTGESYHKKNQVVKEFRSQLNDLLLGYHKKLLIDEVKHMKQRIAINEAYTKELARIADSLDLKEPYINTESNLRVEKVITSRLLEDPFFIIQAMVVWDLEELENYKESRPNHGHWKNIRYNKSTEKWERRVTTEWRVNYDGRQVLKEQGLDLDNNRGYHLMTKGLTQKVTPDAFRDVELNYPIFVNPYELPEQQVAQLKQTFLTNLSHIYDPYSWAIRRNLRFRGGFYRPTLKAVETSRLPIRDTEWFYPVLAHLLNDIATIQILGSDEIYDYEMTRRDTSNRKILGEALDPLNWNPDERRSIRNPAKSTPIQVNFKQPELARFVLLDAYRRRPEQLLKSLQTHLAQIPKDTTASGKDLIKNVLSDLFNMPADAYIKLASQAQTKELKKFIKK